MNVPRHFNIFKLNNNNFMQILFTFVIYFLYSVNGYNTFYRHWTCIGIKDKIDISKPYSIHIGDLPLVLWKDENRWISTIDICKHMGSNLHTGTLHNGCIKCPYHGLEYSYEDRFGETVEHEGKLFWAYKPLTKRPYRTPFYENAEYAKSFLQMDMDASLTDSAYNTMDLRHPEYVHNKLLGFGNTIPPQNIKYYDYPDKSMVGLSFDYSSNPMMRKLNDNVKHTHNFHMFRYPTFSWSRVSFENKHLIIGVNLLPLENKKTRWYITLCHNYYTTNIGQKFMQFLATTILNQDYDQMKNQCYENKLKRQMLFNHIFKDEEVITQLHLLFKEHYEFPDIDSVYDLYKDYSATAI
jgi:phenylpropionate dioxygenase-like ring-hydroxylating dioxygenase large terminal subunit